VLAGFVLEPIVSKSFSLLLFATGLLLSISFWYVNLLIVRRLE
jgi:hypothetical protein